MLAAYRELLEYSSAVTRNAAEKKVNSVLDHVSASTDTKLLQVRGGGWVGGRVVGGWGGQGVGGWARVGGRWAGTSVELRRPLANATHAAATRARTFTRSRWTA